jgi:tetratricopeptide (TPR) repeat protein
VEVPETGLTPTRGAETTVEQALEQMTAGPAVAAPAPGEAPPSEEAVTQGAGETRAPADEIPDWARELEAIGAGDRSMADPVIPPVDAPSESIPASPATEAPSVEATPADDVPAWALAMQDAQAPEPRVVESGADQPIARSRTEELQAKLEVQPGDHQARLELARLSCAEQDWDRALAQYEELVGADEVRLELIGDLRGMLDEDVDPGRVYQLLGDVYMQDGQPDEAVQMYKLGRQG